MGRVQGAGSGMGGQFHQAGNKENISIYHQQLRKHHHHSVPSVEIIYCILQKKLPFKKKNPFWTKSLFCFHFSGIHPRYRLVTNDPAPKDDGYAMDYYLQE